MIDALPIEPLRGAALDAVARGPLVLSAPTGSGKSTQVPRWLRARGRVLVVEPRRVACRALAARVAELDGVELGDAVGYVVRDERRARGDSALVFVTPGIALRMLRSDGLAGWDVLVLDEFHERGMDLDLLLAMAKQAGRPRLVVMSATLEGDRVAAHLGGPHLQGEGRQHPVDVRYRPGRASVPDARGLEDRVRAALAEAEGDPGDVLVFLPGKGEIASVRSALSGFREIELLELHGGLSLAEQSRVFRPGAARRVILSTNVAETSLTLPRIGVVLDAGLVRRTRYHGGRGVLTLLPIAQDSADQRAGRAGRLGPGVCYRLWREDVRLDPVTPPELHREALTPLVLAAAACDARVEALPFLDPPRAYAVDDARAQLQALGGLDDAGRLTPRGERLFALPLDAHLGRLLVEAEARGLLDLAVPLCAGLSLSRPLFGPRPEDPELDLREEGCDAVALIRAVTEGKAGPHRLNPAALDEARSLAERFGALFGATPGGGSVRGRREALAMCLLAAWPDCAHVARRRRRHVAWSNGGTELELGRQSAVDAEKSDALLLLDSRAVGKSRLDKRLVITAGMPVPLRWLVAAGLGRPRLGDILYKRGALRSVMETVYAGKVIASREEAPRGAHLREAARDLILRGSLFRSVSDEARDRHEAASLAARLDGQEPPPPFADWLLQRLADLGLEEAEDLDLLSPEDVLPEALPPYVRDRLDRAFPRDLSIGDAIYRIRYDVAAREAILEQVSGLRKTPPPQALWPLLPGWRLVWEWKGRRRVLRER
ncbi:MAG: ATP-dependent RNA helicase [Alphaproteobacteria bacterium]|nr:ATP-dependent RNA helicase [Alphaproteobacteria bacterium]